MNSKTLLIALTAFAFLTSCTNDSTADLIDSTPIAEEVTYQLNVKSIIDNNCVACHGTVPSNGAPMSLTTYENVKDAVLNNGLIERVILENGQSGQMPLGGPRLPQNRIDEIIKWQTDGFQN